MNVRIDINCENDAFYQAGGAEVARILRTLATKIEMDALTLDDDMELRDYNGQKVGEYIVKR